MVLTVMSAPPKLEVPHPTNGVVTLRLQGDAGSNYRVDGSTNLLTWFPIGSGMADQGWLTLQDTQQLAAVRMFYRGTAMTAASPFPTVQPAFDTNLTGSVVVDPGTGGTVRLGGPQGVVFTLVIPPTALWDSTLVTLTVVTNIVGVPAKDGFIAGLTLQPEGELFSAPVFLQIDFPTSIVATNIASYSFGNDGSQLHLQPDLVRSNQVRIWVTELRGYGCGHFTLDELRALAATVPPPPPAQSSATLLATLDDCYPENVRAANQLRADLTRKARPIQQHIASVLGEARQKALLGVEESLDNSAVVDSFASINDFEQQELIPRIPAASKQCRVGQELLGWLLGIERQRQLLGTDTGEGGSRAGEFMCALTKECQTEAEECCRTHGGDSRLVSFLLGIERQRQLMGMTDPACGTLDDAAFNDCIPQWYGSFRILESANYSTNLTRNDSLRTESESYQFLLETTVSSVSENISPGFPTFGIPGTTNLLLKMGGNTIGSHVYDYHYKDLWDPCSGLALLSARPLDGGDALETLIHSHSEFTNHIDFDINVFLTDDGTGIIPLKSYVQLNPPQQTAPFKGNTHTEERSPTASGCDVQVSGGPINGVDAYGGYTPNLEKKDLLITSNHIYYEVSTNVPASTLRVSDLQITRKVVLDLHRKD